MPKTIVIDSSVFISSLGIGDEYSSDSRRFFDKCVGEEIFVPTLVIAEVLTVLSKQKMKNVNSLLKYFFSFNPVSLDQNFLKHFISLPSSQTTLKTSDLIVAVSALINQSILITWDKKLLSLGGKICTVKTPSEYLK